MDDLGSLPPPFLTATAGAIEIIWMEMSGQKKMSHGKREIGNHQCKNETATTREGLKKAVNEIVKVIPHLYRGSSPT